MRSIWPLLQQLPTSFEHEGAKGPCLEDVRQRLRLSKPHLGPHFMQPKCKNLAILNPPSVAVWTSLMEGPKTHNHHHPPRPDSLGSWPNTFWSWWCWTTDRFCGARDHDTLAHSLVSKSGHGRKNVAVCVRRHHPSTRYGFCALFW